MKIFILASERSGTNLLRVLLNNHSKLCAPVAPHFLDVFLPYIRYYGNLKHRIRMIRLLSDLITYANHPFNKWGINVSPEQVFDKYRPDNLVSAIDAIYTEKTLSEKKTFYVCKDNHLFNYVFDLKAHLQNCKFIYLYRDPRDHVVSWLKSSIHLFSPFSIIKKWNREQWKCLLLEESLGVELYKVKYEELIAEPSQVMSGLLRYLELNVENECFQTRGDNEEANRNILWRNINSPINSGNSNKYKNSLSHFDLKVVELLASPIMQKLQYPIEVKANFNFIDKIRFGLTNSIISPLKKTFIRVSRKHYNDNRPLFQLFEFRRELFRKIRQSENN